jgi:hypothetical protein
MKVIRTTHKPLSENVFISMAKIGYIKDIPIGVKVPAVIQGGAVDDMVEVPSKLLTPFKSPGFEDTVFWWDRQKKIFTVRQGDSFPEINFNSTKEGLVTACKFVWDSYSVNIRSDKLSECSINKLVSLAKAFPHIKYQFILDNGDLKSNPGLKQMLERKLKE